ncbi:hypothetical protein SNEBB_005807 [Seison nebaliae]|nr:hypothetical protein SNEBB_005807 [Seison nebaliae]
MICLLFKFILFSYLSRFINGSDKSKGDNLKLTENAVEVIFGESKPKKFIPALAIEYALVNSKPISSNISSILLFIDSDKSFEFNKLTLGKSKTDKKLICGVDQIGTFMPNTIDARYEAIHAYIYYCNANAPNGQRLHLRAQYFSFEKNGTAAYQEIYSIFCKKEPIVISLGTEKVITYLQFYNRKYPAISTNFKKYRTVSLKPSIKRNFISALSNVDDGLPYCMKLQYYFPNVTSKINQTEANCKKKYKNTIHLYLKHPNKPEPLLGHFQEKVVRKKVKTNVVTLAIISMLILLFMVGAAVYAYKLGHKHVNVDLDIMKSDPKFPNIILSRTGLQTVKTPIE